MWWPMRLASIASINLRTCAEENQHSSQNRLSNVTPVCLHKQRQQRPSRCSATSDCCAAKVTEMACRCCRLQQSRQAAPCGQSCPSLQLGPPRPWAATYCGYSFRLMHVSQAPSKGGPAGRQGRNHLAVRFEIACEVHDPNLRHLPALQRRIAWTAVQLQHKPKTVSCSNETYWDMSRPCNPSMSFGRTT